MEYTYLSHFPNILSQKIKPRKRRVRSPDVGKLIVRDVLKVPVF